MTALLLDGVAAARTIKADLAERVAHLSRNGSPPGLGTLVVGDDPASLRYVAGKHRDCAEVGITSIQRHLPATASMMDVEAELLSLNADPACTGYIVQLPLPRGLDTGVILELIDPDKDADGLHPRNLGRLALGEPGPLPCTPRGCVDLLRSHGIPLDGAHVVVIGCGITVGRPLALLLTRRTENATVVLCNLGTKDLAAEVRRADIVVAAAGVPGLVTREMVSPGTVVLDVGISSVGGRIVGDVALDVREVAAAVSPNPGGIGPMTRAMLLTNIVEASERAALATAASTGGGPR